MLIDKLEAIQERYHYLEEQLSDPEVVSDMKKFKKVSKEYKNLQDSPGVDGNRLPTITPSPADSPLLQRQG